MSTMMDTILARREYILTIARRFGASNVRVFGSVARGSDTEGSDVDFLVSVEPGRSLLDLAGLKLGLEDILGRNVDVATEAGLKPKFRERVLAEAVAI